MTAAQLRTLLTIARQDPAFEAHIQRLRKKVYRDLERKTRDGKTINRLDTQTRNQGVVVMSSWWNKEEMHDMPSDILPPEVKGVLLEHHGKSKGMINVSIKQIIYFKPKPELGKYPNISINGETIIDEEKVAVSCWCYEEDLPVYQHHPERMTFGLMAFERIPESWLEE